MKQDLQMPSQPWTLAHGFLGVVPKSFCSCCKHLPRFISDQCSLSVYHVTMVDLHACLLGFQLHLVWLPSCLARPASDRKPPCFLLRRSEWQWMAISKACQSTWANWKRQTRICSLPLSITEIINLIVDLMDLRLLYYRRLILMYCYWW